NTHPITTLTRRRDTIASPWPPPDNSPLGAVLARLRDYAVRKRAQEWTSALPPRSVSTSHPIMSRPSPRMRRAAGGLAAHGHSPHALPRGSSMSRPPIRLRRPAPLHLETLEDRTVPSVASN